MPKMKTHSGAKKRIKLTGSGKLRRGQAMKGHLMVGKSSRRVRRISGPTDVSAADTRTMKRLLGV